MQLSQAQVVGWDVEPPFSNFGRLATVRHWYEWRYTDYSYNFNGAMSWEWWTGDPGTQPPYRVGADKPPPPQLLLVFEGVDTAFWGLTNAMVGSGTTPFTYRARLPRGYADGHGNVDNSADVGWLAGDQFDGVTTVANYFAEPWYDMRHPEQLVNRCVTVFGREAATGPGV